MAVRLRGRRCRPRHSGAWVDARVASLRCPIPRPGDCSLAAERNRTFHLLIKPDNLTCYQHQANWVISNVPQGAAAALVEFLSSGLEYGNARSAGPIWPGLPC